MSPSLSLPAAVKAAQESDTVLAEMSIPRWALTFKCSEADIMAEWERQEWLRTQQPQNTCEVPDGK